MVFVVVVVVLFFVCLFVCFFLFFFFLFFFGGGGGVLVVLRQCSTSYPNTYVNNAESVRDSNQLSLRMPKGYPCVQNFKSAASQQLLWKQNNGTVYNAQRYNVGP